MKDNRPSSEFEVFANGTYTNDPNEQLFEIIHGADSVKYLVFNLSIMKISMAYDEELMMREVEIGLAIFPEQGKLTFFKNQTQYLIFAVIATILVVVAFITALYFYVLP